VLVYRRVNPIFSPPMALMGLFLLTIGLSMMGSYNKGITLDKFMEVARIVFMTYLIVHLLDTFSRLQGFMGALVIVMAGLSTTIVIRYFAMPETRIEGKGGSGGIAGGFLGDGNDYALAQNVILPWAIALAGAARKKFMRLTYLYTVMIGLMAVGVTYSRGGFLGAAAVLVGMYYLWVMRSKKYAFGLVTGLIGFAAIVIIFLAVAPDDFIERMGSIKDYEQDESAMGRIDAWRASRAMFADHTFLGVGAGAFSEAYGKQYKPIDAVSNVWREAHSAFFQVLGEMGIFGIMTFYGLWLSIWYTAFSLRHTVLANAAEDRFFHTVRGGIYISLIGWAVSSLFLSVAYYPHLFVQAMAVTVLKYFAEKGSAAPRVVEEYEEIEEVVV
jgi:putative inorganic carbon (hco3(-)) transporter